jgi:hypothetical protein
VTIHKRINTQSTKDKLGLLFTALFAVTFYGALIGGFVSASNEDAERRKDYWTTYSGATYGQCDPDNKALVNGEVKITAVRCGIFSETDTQNDPTPRIKFGDNWYSNCVDVPGSIPDQNPPPIIRCYLEQ